MNYKLHTRCRICYSENLVKYIDLGKLPLSNNLANSQDETVDLYPLQVMLCENCGLSQLSVVVNPEILFSHYVYRSSINEGYVKHCRQMAADLKKRYGLTSKSLMVDIAGNDGALLNEFKQEIGLKAINVDPATNLAQLCIKLGIPVYSAFWSKQVAENISKAGKADLITATNVIAHVDDLYDFMEGVKTLLKPTGVFIVEFPYLLDFIEKGEFDTIYFEHLSYLSISPLAQLCETVGLKVLDVEKQAIHGGSVRVHIGHNRVTEFCRNEYKLDFSDYMEFSLQASITIKQFRRSVYSLRQDGYTVAGFAASAKGNTLLNAAGIDNTTMKYIVDETPEKIGKFSPGTAIPIVPLNTLKEDPPDFLVVLSWNFADDIIKKCVDLGYTGDFIIPIPEFKIINNVSNTTESKRHTA